MSDSHTTAPAPDVQTLLKLFNAGAFNEIVALTTHVNQDLPDNYPVTLLRGNALSSLNRHTEALVCFQKALTIKPGNAGALNNLGMSFDSLGRYQEAEHYLYLSFKLTQKKATAGALAQACLGSGDSKKYLVPAFNFLFADFFEKNGPRATTITPFVPMRHWCAARNITATVLSPAGDLNLDGPEAQNIRAYAYDAVTCFDIPNAQAIAGWDYVFAPTGEVLNGSGYADISVAYMFFPHIANMRVKKVVHLEHTEIINIDDDALFLSTPENHHFGHWIVDFLPRLMAWTRPDGTKRKIFIPANLPQHHRDTLSLFGVTEGDLIEGVFGKSYRFKSLTVVNTINKHRPNPQLVRFIYAALSSQIAQMPHITPERHVFLERSQTNRGRTIQNQGELDKILTAFKFEKMRRPDVPVFEQNKILANAGIIMGAFGSDTLALYQLPQGSDLILFYFYDIDRLGLTDDIRGIERTCAILGHRVHRIFGSFATAERNYYSDMTINCTEVRDTLQKITTQRSKKA